MNADITDPGYSRRELRADAAVHLLGLAGSAVALAALLAVVVPSGDTLPIVAASVYCTGLVAMLWLSAAYNLVRRGDWKERLRRADHAAIFLMIAGTYTPFALVSLGGVAGHALLALVWLIAAAGIFLKLLYPRRYERISIGLYLGLGWIGLPLVGVLVAVLPPGALVPLAIGGVLYTVGVGFHLWERLPYHNAVWHGFVLAAAGCHYAAVLAVLSG